MVSADEVGTWRGAVIRRAWCRRCAKTRIRVDRERQSQKYIGFLHESDGRVDLMRLERCNTDNVVKALTETRTPWRRSGTRARTPSATGIGPSSKTPAKHSSPSSPRRNSSIDSSGHLVKFYYKPTLPTPCPVDPPGPDPPAPRPPRFLIACKTHVTRWSEPSRTPLLLQEELAM